MSSNERIKRPRLERTEPLRNWSTLFRGPASGNGAEPASSADGHGGSASLNDVVSRSVDLGYRVIDEYVRQGQKAAQRLNERTYGTGAMASDVQDLAMRMTEYASDFVAVWLQLLQLAAAGSAVASAPAPADGAASGALRHAAGAAPAVPTPEQPAAAAPEPTRVRVEVRSARPTDIAVDLRPDAARRPLIAHALRAETPDAPRITDVRFAPGSEDAAACLRIHVPDGQPPGTYNGLLIDEATSRPVGTVSVTITA